MKIRSGFVTNSSSTNFLIISKEELTPEYLLKKLGFNQKSKILESGYTFVAEIMRGTESGLRWFDFDKIDYDAILKVFGKLLKG